MKPDYRTMTVEDEIRECARISKRLQYKQSIRSVMNELGMDQDDLSQTVFMVYLMTKNEIIKSNLSMSTVINRRIIDQFRSLSKGWGSPRKRNNKRTYFSMRPVSKLKDIDVYEVRIGNESLPVHERMLDMLERDDSLLDKTMFEMEMDSQGKKLS